MAQPAPFWNSARRSLWILLFLLLAIVSMLGPTYAVEALAKAAVVVAETFAQLLGNEAQPAVSRAALKGPASVDEALTPDVSQSSELVPGVATHDTDLLTIAESPPVSANLSSQNAHGSQSEGASGTLGGIGGNGNTGTGGPGGSGGPAPNGAGAAPPGDVFGQDEAITQLTQELGMSDLTSEQAAWFMAHHGGGDSLSGTPTDGRPTENMPGFDPPLGVPPFTGGSSGLGPALEEVLTGVPSVLWSPNMPPDNGARSDSSSALWSPDMPWLESATDNAALSPLGIAKLLDPADPTVLALDGNGQSPNDEPSAGRSVSSVAQVPEPSTLVMLSLGAIALARRRSC
jgi:PEP-CTERM motif